MYCALFSSLILVLFLCKLKHDSSLNTHIIVFFIILLCTAFSIILVICENLPTKYNQLTTFVAIAFNSSLSIEHQLSYLYVIWQRQLQNRIYICCILAVSQNSCYYYCSSSLITINYFILKSKICIHNNSLCIVER